MGEMPRAPDYYSSQALWATWLKGFVQDEGGTRDRIGLVLLLSEYSGILPGTIMRFIEGAQVEDVVVKRLIGAVDKKLNEDYDDGT